jgi:hypothetical protein
MQKMAVRDRDHKHFGSNVMEPQPSAVDYFYTREEVIAEIKALLASELRGQWQAQEAAMQILKLLSAPKIKA